MKFLPVLFLIFVLFSCSKDSQDMDIDPCEGITCLNGGVCINGECDCPERYEGPDCSQQKTPASMKIFSITVSYFPPTDNGAGWDLTSGADIYVEVWKDQTKLYGHSTFYQNADPNGTYTFDPGTINLNDPEARYVIQIMDYDDFDQDDFIAGVEFTPYWDGNGFPSNIDLSTEKAGLSISVDYSF